MTWDELPFWLSEDWLNVQERLHGLDDKVGDKVSFCPGYNNLFRAFDETPLDQVRVAIVGQDPYSNPVNATGLAFSIPKSVSYIPPSLKTILREYSDDLHLPIPAHGDLSSWARSGVLLWNALPTCACFNSMSHDWPEWRRLTDEVIERLCRRGAVFVLVGAIARRHAETINYYELVNPRANVCITVSHPAADRYRGRRSRLTPFVGSRIFSKVNHALSQLGHETIDWRLE